VVSRRKAERLITEGRVQINGTSTRKGTRVAFLNPGDQVRIMGRTLTYNDESTKPPPQQQQQQQQQGKRKPRIWLANKLKGELVTTSDPQGRATISDRFEQMGLTSQQKHLIPVGRLDFNTEGLIIFTNCGVLARNLELPSSRIEREYVVKVRGNVQDSWLNSLRRGIRVGNTRYRPMEAAVLKRLEKGAWLSITLTEGKNREIRRIMDHMRLYVRKLIRVRYGPYALGDIPDGAVREVEYKKII